MVMITTPARTAMEGHGLTDAAVILDDRRTAVAYSVLNPATGRYSLMTLDGRWLIPGTEGYKTRGPATTYARKSMTELRPEGLRVYEPVRHTARPQVGRYGARRAGMCMGQVQSGTTVGYECGSCRAFVSLDTVWRDGFIIVRDGRGTHTLSYALDRDHARPFGEGAAHRVTSPEAETAIAEMINELETIRREMDSIKSLAAEAEAYATTAESGKDAALESRNVAEAYAGAIAAADANRELAFLVKLAIGRCEALDKLRTAFREHAEAVTADGYERDADRLYADAGSLIDSAWEYCGVVEESQRTASAAAKAASAEYDQRCLKCGTFYRQPTRSGESPMVPCACSAMYAGSAADVIDPATAPAPWECQGQMEFGEAEPDVDAPNDVLPAAPVADASEEVPTWAETSSPAVRVTDRSWWVGRYAQWTTGTLRANDAPRAVARFARAAESAGWSVVLRAGTDATDDDTCVGVWEVEATGRCHDNAAGGQSDAVMSVMWSQKHDGSRWTFDRERSVAEIGGRVLHGMVTLSDYERAARTARPMKPEPVAEAAGDAAETALAPVSAATPTAAEHPEEKNSTCTERSADAAPETAAEAVSVAAGPLVVPVTEMVRRARGAQVQAEMLAWDAQTSVNDLAELYGERESLGLSWDQEEGLRKSLARERAVAAQVVNEAFRARVTAESWERDIERTTADMAAMRERTARLFSGGADRSRWVSSDGRTVIALAPSAEQDVAAGTAARFAAALAGAVAAKDAGRMLKSTDVPTKAKHGRGREPEFKQAVASASRPLLQPWKAPCVPEEGKLLSGAGLAALDADGVCAEVETAPDVWMPRAAVYMAETAAANGWAVAMERCASGAVIVRVAGVVAREPGPVSGEIVAVWTDGMYDVRQSSACANGEQLARPADLERVLTTIGQNAEAGNIATAIAPKHVSAPAPEGVSDPCSADVWESDGGACPGVELPAAPGAGRATAPARIALSPETGTCTALAVDGARKRSDVVSIPEAVDTWVGEGGAVPGVETPHARPAQNLSDQDPYAVRPAAAEWSPVPGTTRQTAELTCAGAKYHVVHAPDAVLPYTVRRTFGGADTEMGDWTDLDDVRAIVRADRRRSAALEAHRLRTEQQQRRVAYRMQGERRQAPVRLTEEERRAVARRAEERHRPVAAELYVSPITGSAVMGFVCGTCTTTHDDPRWRPRTLGTGHPTPSSVRRDTLAAAVEKQGWIVSGPWMAHGTRGDTLRAPVSPTPAYLAWVDAHHGPNPQTPGVEPGERITPIQRGWWEVISREGRRYELTWQPTPTGAVWRVRHHRADGVERVARTDLASTALTALRVHAAGRGSQHQGTALRQPVLIAG
ncbi:hypothetical protein ACHGLA_36450 [Streptomyces sp. YH02]|uniref:hypothetical protein n=1 Tax=Streptomyces sp. YH02 TaxID=3256999 RepID=UPI0037576C6D